MPANPLGSDKPPEKDLIVHKVGDQICGEAMPFRLCADMQTQSSRTDADDRLPCASLGRVEGGDGFVEGRDIADVRPQSSVPHPLDDLIQLGTIELDNEVDRQAVGGPRLGRADDGHQCSSGSKSGLRTASRCRRR